MWCFSNQLAQIKHITPSSSITYFPLWSFFPWMIEILSHAPCYYMFSVLDQFLNLSSSIFILNNYSALSCSTLSFSIPSNCTSVDLAALCLSYLHSQLCWWVGTILLSISEFKREQPHSGCTWLRKTPHSAKSISILSYVSLARKKIIQGARISSCIA